MSVRNRKALMILYRLSWITFTTLVVVSFPVDLPFDLFWVFAPAVLAAVVAQVMHRAATKDLTPERRAATVEVDAPVLGRWTALNSPADKIPSHGTHGYGQSFAIDIVAESGSGSGAAGADRERPGFSWLWPLVRPSSAYPAFGAPLLAVADGTVVRATDRQRDHLSRSSLPMLAYLLLLEGQFREMVGASRVVGNTVVLDLGDGTYAMYAHVQRGSLQVRAGDRVTAGQPIARCGNSGNSTEPHIHFQLMDGPDLDTARGIPFRWRGIGIPANGETFTVGDESTETQPPGDSAAGENEALRLTVTD
ncbi:M23 family metallopeptidase [Streptomyces sp. NPDC020965]|uniref:M23 family metallopeptidase n=1 Tax=Streptomyces sp. NPDC020965 TaxID=3365105 RepID=UPI0037B4BB97